MCVNACLKRLHTHTHREWNLICNQVRCNAEARCAQMCFSLYGSLMGGRRGEDVGSWRERKEREMLSAEIQKWFRNTTNNKLLDEKVCPAL